MKITKTNFNIRCELGACNNLASFTITPDRTSSYSAVHICSDCAKELALNLNKLLKQEKSNEKSTKN